ncbi:MAG: NAD(P)H-dependent oxidoreductase [Planctomycetaceae bacterium]|jgi:putative NADPH-quinone reductase|nr:NAD(P)H-dependent oxidoreductase [Planctomycetaceae bacterium]
MSNILINLFHPNYTGSRGNKILAETVQNLPSVTFRHVDTQCSNFTFDVAREQELLEKYPVIIVQHPVMWYNMPPLMKAWYDQVFQYGWAYPADKSKLAGKTLQLVVTTGASEDAYKTTGAYAYTISETFRPQQQTASLCGMQFAPIFAVYGVRPIEIGGVSDKELEKQAKLYVKLVQKYSKKKKCL